jgi:hypothetical protein
VSILAAIVARDSLEPWRDSLIGSLGIEIQELNLFGFERFPIASATTWDCAGPWTSTTCVHICYPLHSVRDGCHILQKILGHSEIEMTMRYVKIAEHYKVEAVVRLEKYRAVQMQEAVVKMQQDQ